MKRLLVLLMVLCLLSGCSAPQTKPVSPTEPPAEKTPSQSVIPPAQEAPQEQSLSPVYTDWSKLTPYETSAPLYTYHPSYGEMLIARDDYGPLLPYVGTVASVSNYIVDQLPLYGLVTTEGEIVTAPIYANIEWWGDFLVLYEGQSTGYRQDPEWGYTLTGSFRHIIMAPDGSWILEPDTRHNIRLFGSDHLLFTTEDGSVRLLNSDGVITAEIPRSAFEPYLGPDFQWTWEGGPDLTEDNGIMAVWWYNEQNANDSHQYVAYLDLENETVSDTPPADWEPFDYNDPANYEADTIPETPDNPEYQYLEPITDPVTGKTYFYGLRRINADRVQQDLLNETGQTVLPDCSMEEMFIFRPFIRAGLASTAENNCFCYKNLTTGETVFRFPVRTNSD